MHPELLHEFDLSGRQAVVTGAGSGIGREIARTFAQAGGRLLLADINGAGLAESADVVSALGGRCAVRVVDISDRACVEALADEAVQATGAADVWINAAGVLDEFFILGAEEAALDRIIAVNLKGTFWACAAAGRVMKLRGRGSIVNISSVAADNPVSTLSAYAMSKASVNMLTRTAAVEFGAFGCRVNAIAPGFVETPMVASAYSDADGRIDPERRATFLRARAAATRLGLTGRPRDIALAALYLASDASRFVTGQVLRVNGGATML